LAIAMATEEVISLIQSIYKECPTAPASEMDSVLLSNKGNEVSLYRSLCEKYGVPEKSLPYAKLITEIYEKYNPSKVAEVHGMVAKYSGKEADLYAAVVKKYCAQEDSEAPTSAASGPVAGDDVAALADKRVLGEVALKAAKGDQASTHKLIAAIYAKHNADKVNDIPRMLDKWKGRQLELYMAICKKYGEAPRWEIAAAMQQVAKVSTGNEGGDAPREVSSAVMLNAATRERDTLTSQIKQLEAQLQDLKGKAAKLQDERDNARKEVRRLVEERDGKPIGVCKKCLDKLTPTDDEALHGLSTEFDDVTSGAIEREDPRNAGPPGDAGADAPALVQPRAAPRLLEEVSEVLVWRKGVSKLHDMVPKTNVTEFQTRGNGTPLVLRQSLCERLLKGGLITEMPQADLVACQGDLKYFTLVQLLVVRYAHLQLDPASGSKDVGNFMDTLDQQIHLNVARKLFNMELPTGAGAHKHRDEIVAIGARIVMICGAAAHWGNECPSWWRLFQEGEWFFSPTALVVDGARPAEPVAVFKQLRQKRGESCAFRWQVLIVQSDEILPGGDEWPCAPIEDSPMKLSPARSTQSEVPNGGNESPEKECDEQVSASALAEAVQDDDESREPTAGDPDVADSIEQAAVDPDATEEVGDQPKVAEEPEPASGDGPIFHASIASDDDDDDDPPL